MYRKLYRLVPLAALILFSTENVMAETLLKPYLQIEERYDSNAGIRAAGQKDEDFVTRITPGLGLSFDRGWYSLNAGYVLDANAHARRSELNHVAHSANLDLKALASPRATVVLSDKFSYAKDSLTAAAGPGIQSGRTDTLSNDLAGALSYMLTPTVSADLSASEGVINFDDPALKDIRTDGAGLALSWGLSPSRTLQGAYSYSNFNFSGQSGKTSSESHSLQAGLNENVSPSLTVSLSGGLSYLQNGSGEYDWNADASLTKTYTRTAVSFVYSRGVTHSGGLTNSLNIMDRLSAVLSYSPSNSFTWTASGNIAKTRSKPEGALDLLSYTATLGGSWQAKRWLTVNFGYSRFSQWDDLSVDRDFTRDHVYAGLKFYNPGIKI